MFTRIGLAVLILAAYINADQLTAEDRDSDLSAFRRLNLSLDDADARRRATNTLFDGMSLEKADLLFDHGDPNVAARAAWQLVATTLVDDTSILDYREERRVQIARFVGRIEGRLNISIPKAWVTGLEDSRFTFESPVDFEKDEIPKILWTIGRKGLDHRKPIPYDGADIITDGVITGACTLNRNGSGQAVLSMPDGVKLTFSSHRLHGLSVAKHNTHVVVFECDEYSGDKYVLHVFDLNTPKAVESHTIKRRLTGSGAGSSRGHLASISFRNSKLFVWGISGEGCYLDLYDSETFKLKVAFTTAN